ncbi:hypothetical protein ABZS88_46785 [Streptomyces sp. NPDC005480]|uniref:hypothetical protein n=1 Tax=Streptomyces sp. NPDC005480 TaxID=3154880 RepID=UPI0033B55E38
MLSGTDLGPHIWQGHHQPAEEARQTRYEVWPASLTPAERTDWEAEREAAYWADDG